MKTLSLKLDDQIFSEAEALIEKSKTSRNRYINEAVAYYNQFNQRQLLEKQLAFESSLVKEDSMNILNKFEGLTYED